MSIKQLNESPQELKRRDRFSRYSGVDNAFPVTYQPNTSGIYHVKIWGEIEDVRQFDDAIDAMDTASENDVVLIHLSTNGGCVDATDTFISAMHRCRARVAVHASGGVHSAGTIILLNAPEFRLSEGFNALLHNGSMGAYSKTSDVKSQTAFQFKQMDRLARETYEGFLSEEEIEQLIGGKDFWMDAEEFTERAEKRTAYMEALEKEEEKLVDSEEETD